MGKAIVVGCFLAVFAFFIAVLAMMIPDHVEAMGFNYIARKTEDMKREAILASPEVQTLEIENDRLHEELRAAIAACVPEQPSWLDQQKERLGNLLPWS